MCGNLKFSFRLDNVNSKIWSLNSFYGHQPIRFTFSIFLFFLIAFHHLTISVVALRDWDTRKEKAYLPSVQVLFIIPMEQLELVEIPFCTRTCGQCKSTSASLFSFISLSFPPFL